MDPSELIINSVKELLRKVLDFIYLRIINRKKLGVIGDNKQCEISIPTYKRRIFDEELETVILSEVTQLCDIIIFLKNVKKEVFFRNEKIKKKDTIEIIIGSPVVNNNSLVYFNDFFTSVKYYINSENYRNSEIDFKERISDFFVINNYYEQAIRYGENESEVLEYKHKIKDYAILIKISNNDFVFDKKKTVHIIFGMGRNGTKEAVNFFIMNYRRLYRDFHNRHYCIALEVNKNGVINQKKEYINLTKHFFSI